MLKFLNGNQINFLKKLETILEKRKFTQQNHSVVKKILTDVKNQGDKAVIRFEKKFSKIKTKSKKIKFSNDEINKISKKIDKKLKNSIDIAFKRIKQFHSKQRIKSFKYQDKFKNELSYNYSPIQNVGVYVPGGTASYPSTVLMNCIPAIVAGVKNIYLATPTLNSKINPADDSGGWYLETGQGMGPSLNIAVATGSYILSDRSTWVTFKNKQDHIILYENPVELANNYGIILVNPEHCPTANYESSLSLYNWLISDAVKIIINSFTVNDQQIFYTR